MDATDLKTLLSRFISTLPLHHQMVLSLSHLSLGEMAKELGLRPSQVYKAYLAAAATIPGHLQVH